MKKDRNSVAKNSPHGCLFLGLHLNGAKILLLCLYSVYLLKTSLWTPLMQGKAISPNSILFYFSN